MNEKRKVRVWDAPTRLFHWVLAGGFVVAWLTREDRWLHVHAFVGYLVLALLLFRLVWGVSGSRHARFGSFLYRPGEALNYLHDLVDRRAARHYGHNPAGSWAIYLLLLLGLVLTATGVMVQGGEENHGPLAGLLSYRDSILPRQLHAVVAWSLLGLVALHLLGVLVESLAHRENLAWSMISGYKPKRKTTESVPAHRGTAGIMILAMLAAAGTWFIPIKQGELPFKSRLPDNPAWRSECGDCHLAYYPSLLPARSWQWLSERQSDHFGEDLALDPVTLEEIRAFLTSNSADQELTESGFKTALSLPDTETPLRITSTPYWKAKHSEIPDSAWRSGQVQGRGDCAACHQDARAGSFEDAAMRIPAAHSEQPPQQPGDTQ